MRKRTYIYWVFCAGGGQVSYRDVYHQISPSQGVLQNTAAIGSWTTGVSTNYRSYDPSNSKYTSVASTRSSVLDPQKGFSNLTGLGRYSSTFHWIANSSQVATASPNHISYLTPSASRPSAYYWGQDYRYTDPTKAALTNQTTYGLNFYRLSNGDKVVFDQFMNDDRHWLYYNDSTIDNNLLTLSSTGTVSKVEGTTAYQDNITNPTTPLLFQTHGGIPENDKATWRTDYSRDSFMQASDRDTYIVYRPNFGSNKQLPTDIELEGEWFSNRDGGRSGS